MHESGSSRARPFVARGGVALLVVSFACLLPTASSGGTIRLVDGWRFRPDPDGTGAAKGWHEPDTPDADWDTLAPGLAWEEQGYEALDGSGWYRRELPLEESWRGRPVYLAIQSVDDGYELWVNGTLAREYMEKEWRKRQATVTRIDSWLRHDGADRIAIRVIDRGDRGGLTGPVAVSSEKRDLNWEALRLPLEKGWRFRADPRAEGLRRGWHTPACDDTDWTACPVTRDGWRCLETYEDYAGEAWYRLDVALPPDWEGERVFVQLPDDDGPTAIYVNGRLVASFGLPHDEDVSRLDGAPEQDGLPGERTILEVTEAIDPGGENTVALRMRRDGERRGLRSAVMLAADRRALIFRRDWRAIDDLARSEPGLILPGWATGRGVTRTITGWPGSLEETFVAADGSFSPSNRSYSVTAWVYDRATGRLHAGERLPLDRIEWSLQGREAPFPVSRWRAGPVTVETLVFVRRVRGDGADRNRVFYRCEVTNVSGGDARLSVFVAIRPYSIPKSMYAFNRGYHPVRELEFRSDESAVLVNGRPGVVALDEPTAFGCTSLVHGSDVAEFAARGLLPARHEIEDWAGLASGAYQFACDLRAGESRRLRFVMASGGVDADPDEIAALRASDFEASFRRTREMWRGIFEKAVKIRLPDRDAEHAFYASLAYLLVLKDHDSLIPGSFGYNAFWTRDAAYMIDACLRAGLHEVARKATELWAGFQQESGKIPSMGPGGPNEWDGQGQALYSFVQVYRYTRDQEWLAAHWPLIYRAARYIETLRSRTLTEENEGTPIHGILPPSLSAEDLGPRTWHHYWDDFWCIRGLDDALHAARALGKREAAEEIETWRNALAEATLRSIRQVMETYEIAYIPASPEGPSSSGRARGTSPAIWPGGALRPDDPLVVSSFDRYWDEQIAPHGGGYWHGGSPWPYAGLALAHCYLNLGQRDRADRMLRWTLDHQSGPGVYAWAEVAHGSTGLLVGGDVPHGWACAEYVSLVRDMLVREEDGAILLASGVPERWFDNGRQLELERAMTPFGRVGYRYTSSLDAGSLELQLDLEADPPGGFFWPLPRFRAPIASVEIDGKMTSLPADRRLPIPRAARRVALRFDLSPPEVSREPARYRMQRLTRGKSARNLYAAVDDERPLLGVYFYFVNAGDRTNRRRLRSVAESFDFVQINPTGSNVRRCEQERVPWVGVDQPAIPLGRDSDQWSSARSVIRSRIRDHGGGHYLLGWNSGSEPHTSFRTPPYTGHTRKMYEKLGVAEPTRQEFIEWLAGQYGDESPRRDTNGDGITLCADFGLDLDSWDAVAQPAHRRTEWFEHVLAPFRCRLIRDCVDGRLAIFREHDPDHAVTPRLLRSLDDPRMSYDLTYLDRGDAAGVTFYCGGGVSMGDPFDTGARVKVLGTRHEGAYRFGYSMAPPCAGGREGVAQASFSVRLPDRTPVRFTTALASEAPEAHRCRIEVLPAGGGDDGRREEILTTGVGPEYESLEVDLSRFAGRRIRLRLTVDPGRSRETERRYTHWLEPRIHAGERLWADLVEHYMEARAGYRLRDRDGRPGPLVWLGVHGSYYQTWYADQVMSLVAGRARLAGKRAVANEFHPGSGSPRSMFPMAIYDSVVRLMQFRVPSVAFFCHMYRGDFTSYDMASSEAHVARIRNQTVLWRAYRNVPERRRSDLALFIPSRFATVRQAEEGAKRFGTQSPLIWAAGELGADSYLLNDLEQADRYENIILFLAYADREAEDELHTFLTDVLPRKRVLILTSVSSLWGPVGRRRSKRIDACLEDELPVSPAGSRLVERHATILPGLRARMELADRVRLRELAGFEPIEADDGSVVGQRSSNVLCLAGFPETPVEDRIARGWRDTTLRRLIHRWFDLTPGRIDAGAIQIVTRDLTATRPGIYTVENSSVLTLGAGLAGYDVLHRSGVEGYACGPAVIRVWPGEEPLLVDPDVCLPLDFEEARDGITATLQVPRHLRVTRPPTLTIYWPGERPVIRLDGKEQTAACGTPGFYRIPAPAPGVSSLDVRAAARQEPPAASGIPSPSPGP